MEIVCSFPPDSCSNQGIRSTKYQSKKCIGGQSQGATSNTITAVPSLQQLVHSIINNDLTSRPSCALLLTPSNNCCMTQIRERNTETTGGSVIFQMLKVRNVGKCPRGMGSESYRHKRSHGFICTTFSASLNKSSALRQQFDISLTSGHPLLSTTAETENKRSKGKALSEGPLFHFPRPPTVTKTMQ